MTQAMRMLLAEGLITADDFESALASKASRGGSLSQILVESGAIDSEELARFLARRFPIPRWTRQRLALVPPDVLSVISRDHARALRVLPVAREGGRLTFAIADPTDAHAISETTRAVGHRPALALASEADMSFALEQHYARDSVAGAPEGEVPLPLVRRPAGTQPSSTSDDASAAIPLVQRRAPNVPEPKLDCDTWSTGPVGTIALEANPDAIVDAVPLDGSAERNAGRVEADGAAGAVRALSEGELIAAIGEASERDAVISLALEYLRRCADRAAFFAVKRGEIRGVRIIDDRVRSDSARTLFLPLSAPSTLRRVAEARQMHFGPLDRTAADAVLSAALGGRPERVLVVPVILHDKAVGLLMADGFSSALPPRARLERLAAAVADAFAKLIARAKVR